jgi:hypothetical protein
MSVRLGFLFVDKPIILMRIMLGVNGTALAR